MKHISDKLTDINVQDSTDEPHKRTSIITFLNQFIPVSFIRNIIITQQNRCLNTWHNYHYFNQYACIPVSHPAWQGNSEFLSR